MKNIYCYKIDYDFIISENTINKLSIPYKNFVLKLLIFIETLKKHTYSCRQIKSNLIKYDYSNLESVPFNFIIATLTKKSS